jgi:hypothetical protein
LGDRLKTTVDTIVRIYRLAGRVSGRRTAGLEGKKHRACQPEMAANREGWMAGMIGRCLESGQWVEEFLNFDEF